MNLIKCSLGGLMLVVSTYSVGQEIDCQFIEKASFYDAHFDVVYDKPLKPAKVNGIAISDWTPELLEQIDKLYTFCLEQQPYTLKMPFKIISVRHKNFQKLKDKFTKKLVDRDIFAQFIKSAADEFSQLSKDIVVPDQTNTHEFFEQDINRLVAAKVTAMQILSEVNVHENKGFDTSAAFSNAKLDTKAFDFLTTKLAGFIQDTASSRAAHLNSSLSGATRELDEIYRLGDGVDTNHQWDLTNVDEFMRTTFSAFESYIEDIKHIKMMATALSIEFKPSVLREIEEALTKAPSVIKELQAIDDKNSAKLAEVNRKIQLQKEQTAVFIEDTKTSSVAQAFNELGYTDAQLMVGELFADSTYSVIRCIGLSQDNLSFTIAEDEKHPLVYFKIGTTNAIGSFTPLETYSFTLMQSPYTYVLMDVVDHAAKGVETGFSKLQTFSKSVGNCEQQRGIKLRVF